MTRLVEMDRQETLFEQMEQRGARNPHQHLHRRARGGRIIDAALEHGGGIDVLVNNAGNRYAASLA